MEGGHNSLVIFDPPWQKHERHYHQISSNLSWTHTYKVFEYNNNNFHRFHSRAFLYNNKYPIILD